MLSPARTARLRPPISPPGISTSIATSPEMNIIAPASERSSSPGWSETITAGAWPSRTVASTPRILSEGAWWLGALRRRSPAQPGGRLTTTETIEPRPGVSAPETGRHEDVLKEGAHGGTRGSPVLGDVAKHLRVAERPQLLQALVLDLADPLARDVEHPPHLVERARMLAIQPVAELEHLALTLGEHAEHAAERRLPQLALGDLVGERLRLVGQEVSELGFLLVADRFLQRDRSLRGAADLLDLLEGELDVAGDFRGGRLAPELGAQLALGADDLVQSLDDVNGHANRPCLVGECPGYRLPDPPGGVGRELETLAVVELLRRTNKPDRPFLDQ